MVRGLIAQQILRINITSLISVLQFDLRLILVVFASRMKYAVIS